MYLLRMRVKGLGPFDDIELGFDDNAEPRRLTVIHGGGGVGKTTLLTALASTRPGNAVVALSAHSEREQAGQVVCEFHLGLDAPDRPHALVVASPNARVYDDDERETIRRREQNLFDRVARETGFMFLAFPATRTFARQPIVITGRGLSRYDVRAPIPLDDPSRADLARDTKQSLAYATITPMLAGDEITRQRFSRLSNAMTHAVDTLLELLGFRWQGLDPFSLEPVFKDPNQRVVTFDQLPTRARHLVAFATLTVRALWAAYPHRDPLEAEGIVVIDEACLHQDSFVQTHLTAALTAALPKVQWILTVTSPLIAASCATDEVIVLRQAPEHDNIEPFTGALARLH